MRNLRGIKQHLKVALTFTFISLFYYRQEYQCNLFSIIELSYNMNISLSIAKANLIIWILVWPKTYDIRVELMELDGRGTCAIRMYRLLTSELLPRNTQIKIYRMIIVPVLLKLSPPHFLVRQNSGFSEIKFL